MMEYLFSWYGAAGAVLVLLMAFVVFSKVMGLVWRLVFFGIIGIGGFFYVRSLIS